MRAFAIRWASMTVLWLLLAGKADAPEVVAALTGGLLAAVAGNWVRRGAEPIERPRGVRPGGWARVAAGVVRDTGTITRVVWLRLRGRPVPGSGIVALPFTVVPDGEGAGRRALAELAGTLAAGTVVIGVDAEHQRLLAHRLGPSADPDPLRLGDGP